MLSALRRLFAPKEIPALRELSARITALELSEAERERVLAEQLQRLANYWKRLRQRDAMEEKDEDRSFDQATARQVLAMKLRNGGA